MRISDWSSDVCSSDLIEPEVIEGAEKRLADFGPREAAGRVLGVIRDLEAAHVFIGLRSRQGLRVVRFDGGKELPLPLADEVADDALRGNEEGDVDQHRAVLAGLAAQVWGVGRAA